MTELRAFNNPEFGTIRTIVENGKTLFCGADVARILGYAKPQNAIAKRCKGALKRGTLTSSGIQEMLFIPEADLYRLAFGSKLPTAEKFTDWVVEEVLPSIHETGGYSLQKPQNPALPDGVTFSSAVGFMRLIVQTAGRPNGPVQPCRAGGSAMKIFEVTVTRDRITIRREAEERLTAEQKYRVILSVIACIAFLGFFALSTNFI